MQRDVGKELLSSVWFNSFIIIYFVEKKVE